MLIEPDTAASTVVVSMDVGTTLQVQGDLSSDVIAIEIPDGAGGWKSLTENNVVIQLDSDNEQITSYGNTNVRINKPITSNSVGVARIG